jgi:hypothetical protein
MSKLRGHTRGKDRGFRSGGEKRPEAEKLVNDPSFRLILELEFDEMIPFVLENIRKRSIISLFYIISNLALLGMIIIYLISAFSRGDITFSILFKQAGLGIVCGSIPVIPLHELLHGLAYRILGARKIRFGSDLKQFIFYVTADRFPVSGPEIYFLAFTPFMVINILLAGVTLLWMPQLILFTLFFLLSHNIMCIGDFAISNYVLKHGDGKVYSYDEIDRRRSYFFEKTG